MAYATNADIEQRMGSLLYVQLTDDAGVGAADESKVTAARLAAEAEVNSYLGRRYSVPVDTTNESEVQAVLCSITLDLVEYRLHARRPPVPAEVATRRAAAVDWLRRVADGRAVLPSAAELPLSSSGGLTAAAVGPRRSWTRDEADHL